MDTQDPVTGMAVSFLIIQFLIRSIGFFFKASFFALIEPTEEQIEDYDKHTIWFANLCCTCFFVYYVFFSS